MKIIISQGENFERAPAPCGEGQGQECVIADRGLSIKFFTIIHNHDHPNKTMDIVNFLDSLIFMVYFQVHKRFDPIYSDARMRIQKLGEWSAQSEYFAIIIIITRPSWIVGW